MSGVFNYQFRLNVVLIFKIEFLIYYYVWYTNQCFMLYKVILAVVDYGPQHRSFGMSAYYFMQVGETDHNIVKSDFQFLQTLQVGETATTLKLAKSQLTITCKLAGPQHSEIGSSISTDIASWRGLKLRSWWKVSFYEYNKKAR